MYTCDHRSRDNGTVGITDNPVQLNISAEFNNDQFTQTSFHIIEYLRLITASHISYVI